MSKRQLIFSFSDALHLPSMVLGGKGKGLSTLVELGLPVPPGFIISTSVSRSFEQHKIFSKRLVPQIFREMSKLEKLTNKTFGVNLFVSVRSGSPVSMPGMMNTKLDVGRERDPYLQLIEQISFIVNSWNLPRAKEYRRINKIPDWLNTAVIVQSMVYGNKSKKSGTGVIFSKDTNTGEDKITGEFLLNSTGEDLVSGKRTPLPILQLKDFNEELYNELKNYCSILENYYNDVIEIEFTFEDSKLYLLQVRIAKCSNLANIKIGVHNVWNKKISKRELCLKGYKPIWNLSKLGNIEKKYEIASGLTASGQGALVGYIVKIADIKEIEKWKKDGSRIIILRDFTTPEDLPLILVADGVVTKEGGMSSHAAIICRELNKPAIVGVGQKFFVDNWYRTILDLDNGKIYSGYGCANIEEIPFPKEVSLYNRWINRARNIKFGRTPPNRPLLATDTAKLFYLLEISSRKTNLVKNEFEDLKDRIIGIFTLYLFVTVVGESRHYSLYCNDSDLLDLFQDLKKTLSIDTERETTHISAQIWVYDKPINKIIDILKKIEMLFNAPKWSKSYGGKKWADICRILILYLEGQITDLIFIDQVFDLEHNCGCVFNKNKSYIDQYNNIKDFLNYKKCFKGELIDFLNSYKLGGYEFIKNNIKDPKIVEYFNDILDKHNNIVINKKKLTNIEEKNKFQSILEFKDNLIIPHNPVIPPEYKSFVKNNMVSLNTGKIGCTVSKEQYFELMKKNSTLSDMKTNFMADMKGMTPSLSDIEKDNIETLWYTKKFPIKEFNYYSSTNNKMPYPNPKKLEGGE